MFQKTLTFAQLGITPNDVCGQMGYHDHLPTSRVMDEVAAAIRGAATVARPRFCFTVLPGSVSPAEGTLTVDSRPADAGTGAMATAGQLVFGVGRIIARQLHGAQAFAFFLATAGQEFETWRQQGDQVRRYTTDALGSLMAEHCADRMEEALQASIGKLGWQHTNRFSPGYCGWDVAEQQHLLPLLGSPNACGVTLTSGSLMLPVKSVSGVIGLGPHLSRRPYKCDLCNYKQCFRRRH